MALLHIDFFSNVLGMCTNMDVILPQRTEGLIGMEVKSSEKEKIRTLYLLHGYSDDHTIWQRRTSIERYASKAGIAVVMPTTYVGRYADMKHGQKFFSYIAKELPKICREFFPQLSDKREDTFVAGLSMGGFGSVKCALLCPETFSKSVTLSGNLDTVSCCKRNGIDDHNFYNSYGSLEELEGSENDLFADASRLADSDEFLPKIYQWCGTEDSFYPENVRFRDHLQSLGYPITYSESHGTHAWEYWDEQIRNAILWLLEDNSIKNK